MIDRRAPKDIVRDGYDTLSHLYRGDDETPEAYAGWVAGLCERLPAGAAVLDLGCGCGVPIARDLAASGRTVTGIDLSGVQIARARRLVPTATFQQADATTVGFPDATFDAVVCLYALIHMPLQDQPSLLDRVGKWLVPGGWLLATTGVNAWTGSETGWLGGTAEMWWSHPDADTYRRWISHAGLVIVAEDFVAEGDGGHQVFWARRAVESGSSRSGVRTGLG